MSRRIVFIQTGDFREAAHRWAETGQESYHAQRHSMKIVETLAREEAYVGVICTSAKTPYAERLPSGVETAGFILYTGRGKDLRSLSTHLAKARPSHIVLRLPDPDVLRICCDLGANVLPTFADTLAPRAGLRGLPDRLRHRRLARLLNSPAVEYVGNHNIMASDSLCALGVRTDKIIPWDWPRPHRPEDFAPKSSPEGRALKLLFAGTISEAKGLGDILRALAALAPGQAELTILGAGQLAPMRALADTLGIAKRVTFRGHIPFAEVMPEMRAHDAAVVFSRPGYAEGLPGVIYQALAARLPLLLSPHPVFRHYFTNRTDVLFAADFTPAALAACLSELAGDRALYAALSQNSAGAFHKIWLDTDWVQLVQRWLHEDRNWLDHRTLARHKGAAQPDPAENEPQV